MTHAADVVELELFRDLETLDERLGDQRFCTDLYRALSNTAWRKDGLAGHVSLSWSRAEEIVNELRARRAHAQLQLAQTGNEGSISRAVGEELGRRGWRAEPLDTDARDPEHQMRPTSPPPQEQGSRSATGEDPGAWERRAHAEAEEGRRPTVS